MTPTRAVLFVVAMAASGALLAAGVRWLDEWGPRWNAWRARKSEPASKF